MSDRPLPPRPTPPPPPGEDVDEVDQPATEVKLTKAARLEARAARLREAEERRAEKQRAGEPAGAGAPPGRCAPPIGTLIGLLYHFRAGRADARNSHCVVLR